MWEKSENFPQRNKQITSNVTLGEPDLAGLRAIHVHMELGLIERLLNAQIDSAGHVTELLQQSVGELAGRFEVGSHDLDVDRRGQAEVQNLADNVGRKKRKRHTREFVSQPEAQIVNILVGRVMVV